METKKFSTFEFGGSYLPARQESRELHIQHAFDSPYGHAIVLASALNAREGELTADIIDRINYYLHNEREDDPAEVCRNALIYTSGYLYQQQKKDGASSYAQLGCLCAIVRNDQVYYGALGQACLWIKTDRTWRPLLTLTATVASADKEQADQAPASGHFLGSGILAEPVCPSRAFQPVAGDMVLLGSGPVCQVAGHKSTRQILGDNMPLQTKVSRVLRQVSDREEGATAAVSILHFYQSTNATRAIPVPIIRAQEEQSLHTKKMTAKRKKTKQNARKGGIKSWTKNLFSLLVLFAVGYMVYDLFIYDPRPPMALPPATELPGPDLTVDVEDFPLSDAGPPAELPDDIPYRVRSGDTWSRIYLQFGVCSWFIRNHPPNVRRLGSRAGLMADVTLMIPVRYSSNPDYNPYYYTEFTTDKVGSNCQNVNEAFRDAFEEMVGAQNR